MVVAVVIGVFAYLAVGVVVLSRAEGTSVLDQILQIILIDVRFLFGVLTWPLLLAFRQGQPVAARGQAVPAPSDRGYVGADAEAITDLRPWGRVRVREQNLDARAETGFVAAGAGVRVVGVERGGLVVRRESA